MALSANAQVDEILDLTIRHFDVAASTTIYQGGLVSLDDDGYLIPHSSNSGPILGMALEKVDNSSGSDGDLTCEVRVESIIEVYISGAVITDVGREMYATDDDINSSSSSAAFSGSVNDFLGIVVGYKDSTSLYVQMQNFARGGGVGGFDPKDRIDFFDDFLGITAPLLNETGSEGIWEDIATGTVTIVQATNTAGGAALLTTDATDEAQLAGLTFGDSLQFNLSKGIVFECRLMITSAALTDITAIWGLAAAHNATADSVATNLWFRLEADFDLMVETDEGATPLDNDDNDTTVNLTTAVFANFKIDARNLADVRFFHNELDVTPETMDISGVAANTGVQPYFRVGKASGTTLATMTIDWVRIQVGGRG